MSAIRWTVHDSPIGELTLVASEEGLVALGFERPRIPAGASKAPMPEVAEQIDAYFAGELRQFDLPLDLRGTPLERAVWQRLLEIPYGETATYGQQATSCSAVSRSVAMALSGRSKSSSIARSRFRTVRRSTPRAAAVEEMLRSVAK